MSKYHSYILNLKNTEANQFDLIGQQGLDWKRFFAADISVAEGFVLSSAAFDDFVTAGNLIEPIGALLSNLDIDDEQSAVEISDEISALIQNTNLPSIIVQPLLQAYRSLNGISEKHVQISCSWVIDQKFMFAREWQMHAKGEAALLVGIKKAWQQLFSKQNLKLRAAKAYNGGLSMSVIVQKFPTPEVSGSAFSLNTNHDIEVLAQLGIFDPNSGSDTYKVANKDLQIYEKVIYPQQKMLLHKSRGSSEENPEIYISVPVSVAWQTFQKIPDSVVEKIAKQVVRAADILGGGVEFNWSWETGHLHIYSIQENKPLPAFASQSLEQKVKKQLKIIQLPGKNSKPTNINQLAAEVERLVEIGEQQTEQARFIPPQFSNSNVAKTDWQDVKSQLGFGLILDVSILSSDTLSQAAKYDGFYFDATQMVLRGKILPELIAETDLAAQQKLVQIYLLELKLLAAIAYGRPIYYQFSDIGEWELREMHQQTDLVVDGLERLLTHHQILSIEWEAIRLARKEYGLSNLKLVLPKVRNIVEIAQAKKILSSLGFNRTGVSQLLAEVSLPAILSQLKDLGSNDLDGLVINLPELSQQLLSKRPTEMDLRSAISDIGEALKQTVTLPINVITPVNTEVIKKLARADINLTSVISLRPFTESELTDISLEVAATARINSRAKKRGRPSKSLF